MTRPELLDPPARVGPSHVLRSSAAPLDGPARAHALAELAAARPLALCLDIDGTLAPIAPRPEDARTPESTLHTLERLGAHPDVCVALVTGRAPDAARALVPVAGLWVVGNHGAETLAPNAAAPDVDPAVAAHAPALERLAADLAPLASTPGVLVENKRWSLSLHTRLAPPDAHADLVAHARALGEAAGLRVDAGKSVLEFKAPVEVDKGTATLALLASWGALDPAARAFAAGDDATDEHLFRRLRDAAPAALTVRVGDDVPTWAEYRVDHPPALGAFLRDLADALGA
ncbi:MAG TPA: trehalose-phosphatase [Gemmatirosa sp.]